MADRPVAAPSPPGRALVPVLAAFPDELSRMLQGYSTEALKRPASDGGWGVIENLGHLRDWEAIFLERVTAMLTLDNPTLPEHDDQLWEIEHDYRGQDPQKVLDWLRQQRKQLVELLSAMPAEGWHRAGRVGGDARVTVDLVVQQVRQHDAEHAKAISEALA